MAERAAVLAPFRHEAFRLLWLATLKHTARSQPAKRQSVDRSDPGERSLLCHCPTGEAMPAATLPHLDPDVMAGNWYLSARKALEHALIASIVRGRGASHTAQRTEALP